MKRYKNNTGNCAYLWNIQLVIIFKFISLKSQISWSEKMWKLLMCFARVTMFVCVAPQDRGGAYGRGTSIVEGPIDCLGDHLGSEPLQGLWRRSTLSIRFIFCPTMCALWARDPKRPEEISVTPRRDKRLSRVSLSLSVAEHPGLCNLVCPQGRLTFEQDIDSHFIVRCESWCFRHELFHYF